MAINKASLFDDSSEYLVHLVGNEDPYEKFMSILSSGRIEARNPFGVFRKEYPINSVCFSEIPPKFLIKLMKRHGNNGIAFKKEKLIELGASRVWYLEKDKDEHLALLKLNASLSGESKCHFEKIIPFIDVSGDFNAKKYRFEWEREWRLLGNLSFSPSDVSFLIIPGELHDVARSFFQDAEVDQTGPNYPCPFYDPILNKETE